MATSSLLSSSASSSSSKIALNLRYECQPGSACTKTKTGRSYRSMEGRSVSGSGSGFGSILDSTTLFAVSDSLLPDGSLLVTSVLAGGEDNQ